jgi:hypothetical protein
MDVRCMVRDAAVGAALAAGWPMAAHAQLTLGQQSTVVQRPIRERDPDAAGDPGGDDGKDLLFHWERDPVIQ